MSYTYELTKQDKELLGLEPDNTFHNLNKSQKFFLFGVKLHRHEPIAIPKLISEFGIVPRTLRRWKEDFRTIGIGIHTWRCKLTKTKYLGTPQAFGKAMIELAERELNMYPE